MTNIPPSRHALFRFAVLSPVLARLRLGEPPAIVIDDQARRLHADFVGSLRRVSPRTIYRWLAAYRDRGVAGLEPEVRASASRALPLDFVEFLRVEKTGDRDASIPELIRRAREIGVLHPDQSVDRSTVYRACLRLELPVARRRSAKDRDSRRFSFPHRLDMVLCDGKHFRAGAKRLRRVVLIYLDDATRYVLHLVVGPSESGSLFQRGLYECICRHGSMSAVYVDRGSGFIAEDTLAVFSNLDIPLIHGEAGYKEGRGKVERINRTLEADLLRGLDGRPDIDPSYSALELRLRHYFEKQYATRIHESLGGQTPSQRFHADSRALRFPEDRESLRQKFQVWLKRRVSTDHVVSIDSVPYEMPRGYAGRRVQLQRHLLDGTIRFVHDAEIIVLKVVDLQANAHAPRGRGEREDPPRAMPPQTAAEIAFRRDFGSLLDVDGGFSSDDDD